MKKLILLTCLLSLGGFATAATSTTTTTSSATKVDNTKVNERDANRETITPEDQARGSESDVELTRRIRQEIVADKTLSTNAQNVKIITLNGVVTLRGPVDAPSEKRKIDALAKKVSGVQKVDNQIEVKTRVQ